MQASAPTLAAGVGRPVGDPQDRKLRRVAQTLDGVAHEDRLRALGLGVPRAGGVLNGDDHRDAVSLGDRLTEAA